jgi:hypothetical protein
MARYRFENRSRHVLRFPVYKRAESRVKGVPGQLVREHDKDLVLGDSADKTLKPGVSRGPKCPDPVADWDDEVLSRLSPVQLDVLERYVADGTITRIQIAA